MQPLKREPSETLEKPGIRPSLVLTSNLSHDSCLEGERMAPLYNFKK